MRYNFVVMFLISACWCQIMLTFSWIQSVFLDFYSYYICTAHACNYAWGPPICWLKACIHCKSCFWNSHTKQLGDLFQKQKIKGSLWNLYAVYAGLKVSHTPLMLTLTMTAIQELSYSLKGIPSWYNGHLRAFHSRLFFVT